jgi:cytidylate kinase
VDLDRIKKNLTERDAIDSSRKEGPLKKAEDAELMDTSHLTIEEQVDKVVEMAMGKIVG